MQWGTSLREDVDDPPMEGLRGGGGVARGARLMPGLGWKRGADGGLISVAMMGCGTWPEYARS